MNITHSGNEYGPDSLSLYMCIDIDWAKAPAATAKRGRLGDGLAFG